MKVKLALIFIVVFMFVSCVYEREMTIYYFKFINKTNDTVFVQHEDFAGKNSFDTILPQNTFNISFGEWSPYKNYDDTLLTHWFKHLEVVSNLKSISRDPLNANNWKWPKDLRKNGAKNNEITVLFEFEINQSDLNSK